MNVNAVNKTVVAGGVFVLLLATVLVQAHGPAIAGAMRGMGQSPITVGTASDGRLQVHGSMGAGMASEGMEEMHRTMQASTTREGSLERMHQAMHGSGGMGRMHTAMHGNGQAGKEEMPAAMQEMHDAMHGNEGSGNLAEEELDEMKAMHERMHAEDAEASWEECQKMHEKVGGQ